MRAHRRVGSRCGCSISAGLSAAAWLAAQVAQQRGADAVCAEGPDRNGGHPGLSSDSSGAPLPVPTLWRRPVPAHPRAAPGRHAPAPGVWSADEARGPTLQESHFAAGVTTLLITDAHKIAPGGGMMRTGLTIIAGLPIVKTVRVVVGRRAAVRHRCCCRAARARSYNPSGRERRNEHDREEHDVNTTKNLAAFRFQWDACGIGTQQHETTCSYTRRPYPNLHRVEPATTHLL